MTDQDANTYVTPPAAADGPSPQYPKWMFHPTKGSQIVTDSSAEAVLTAGDPLWSSKDPNVTT